MSDKAEGARKRVLDFLDEWTSRGHAQPYVWRISNDEDEWLTLNVSDLYVLADAVRELDPITRQQVKQGYEYALSTPKVTDTGLIEGLDLHPISPETAQGILNGTVALGVSESIMVRRDGGPWIMAFDHEDRENDL